MTVQSSNVLRQSALGQYEGYSAAIYNGSKRYSIYLPMNDGVKIALDYYIPTKDDCEETVPLPVLLHLTPYDRIQYGRKAKRFNPFARADLENDALVLNDNGMEHLFDLRYFGYVVAIADCRGTGASFGTRSAPNSRREAEDGKTIVEWLISQPFCSGKVGTFGFSYHGGTQLGLMSMQPKGLTAAFIGCTDLDKYDGWVRGGIPRAFGSEPDVLFGNTPEEIRNTVDALVENTVPVDADPGRQLLRAAICEHIANERQIPILRDLNWRDSCLESTGKPHWITTGNSYYLEELNSTGTAVYLLGGVYDVFRKETFSLWRNLNVPKKLLVGPWYHTAPKIDVAWWIEALRWFDYWLKDIDNGIMDEAPVTLRMAKYNFRKKMTTGSGTGYYREEADWPVRSGSRTSMYLTSGNALDSTPGEQALIPYSCAYGCVTSVESILSTEPSGPPYMPVHSDPHTENLVMDNVGLVFTGAPLKQAIEVIGHPMAHVDFSMQSAGWMTEKFDLDLFVTLIDYEPTTRSGFVVTSGQLRASLRRESTEHHYDTGGLPWHRCNQGDNEWLELGKKYRLAIDLLPTSYIFEKGHCLRVTITNSLKSVYYSGMDTYELDRNLRVPHIHVYVGGEDASRIELPNLYD